MASSLTPRLPLRGLLLVVGIASAAWSGCEKQLPANRFDILTGTVQSLHADVGQLTIRTSSLRADPDASPYVHCVLGGDAEVYINDRFSALAAIQIGDTAELIGYRDPDRAERFLVCLVHITRSEPLPPAPDLSLPSTQTAATAPSEQRGRR
jgi:hypothetical protein